MRPHFIVLGDPVDLRQLADSAKRRFGPRGTIAHRSTGSRFACEYGILQGHDIDVALTRPVTGARVYVLGESRNSREGVISAVEMGYSPREVSTINQLLDLFFDAITPPSRVVHA